MFDIRRRQYNLVWAEIGFNSANVKSRNAFEYKVDLIGPVVRMTLLLLTWFETIDVREHPLGLKQIDLLHFVSRKGELILYVLGLH